MHAEDSKLTALRNAIGRPKPPRVLSQDVYDGDPKYLRRLVALKRGELAMAGDLWDYTQSLRYTDIQRDLFIYLLPFCLQAWREDLLGANGYGAFVEHFYPVLADRNVFDSHLT